jgi:NMD protein affecting ribosome stability and mRNA decay
MLRGYTVRKYEAGDTFNSWTLLGKRRKRKKMYYELCRCACGKTKYVPRGNLVYGYSKQCARCGAAAAGQKRRDQPSLSNKARALGLSLQTVLSRRRRGMPEELVFTPGVLTTKRCMTCGSLTHTARSHDNAALFEKFRVERPNVSRQRITQLVHRAIGLCQTCGRKSEKLNGKTRGLCVACTRRAAKRARAKPSRKLTCLACGKQARHNRRTCDRVAA